MELTTRNATLEDLAKLLTEQHARKLDLVVPASKLRSEGGDLIVEGAEPVLLDDGVMPADGVYRPTSICDEGVADKLGVPLAYVRRMRAEAIDLYDANVNGWLHGSAARAADPRSFLLRCYRGDDGIGVARALLSDRYGMIDHLDVVAAALEGVLRAGVETEVVGCDLSERSMRMRIACPDVAVLAPTLLAGYRSPNGGWTVDRAREVAAREGHGYPPGQEPVVFAGFEIGNSETGGGAFGIVPRVLVQMCSNGLTFTMDALRQVHLGGKLDEGVVRWSDDTMRRSLELVTAKATDAVHTFLDVEYVTRKIAELEEKAGTEIAQPQKVVETIGKKLRFTQEQTDSILAHFIKGGQTTVGGVLNAVTAYAHDVADPDTANDVEAQAVAAFDLAHQLVTAGSN